MATTTNLAIPYPAATDAPDGPGAIYAAAARIDALAGDGTFGYAGTCKDYGGGFVTTLRRTNLIGVLVLNIDPGANGLSASTGNSLIGALPTGFRPNTPLLAEATIGLGSGARAKVYIGTDGTVGINWTSASIASGTYLTANAVFPLA